MQSAEKGQQLFEDLRKFSFETTFGVDELASASSQLLNAGMAVSGLNDNLKMLGDLAQGDKGKFQELTSIFAKVQNTGRATSIQLQQLALRGIPIQKTLKEMGVTGTASAEQLTEAFKKLTDEGGQFHDAMNNIIDTIEGKRGFIADTLKEIYVNFGEVTGITDAYKSTLDFLYSILEKVNNKLMEWNENPIMKALMSGLLTAVLTGLVTIIGVGLVSALMKINAQLAITATLSGPVGWIALAVAGVAALGVAVVNLRKSLKENAEVSRRTTEEMERQKYLANEIYSNPETNSNNAQMEQLKKELESYNESKKIVQDKLDSAQKEMKDLLERVGEYDRNDAQYEFVEEERKRIEGEIDKWTKRVEIANGVIKDTENSIKRVEERISKMNQVNALKDSFTGLYEEIHNLISR